MIHVYKSHCHTSMALAAAQPSTRTDSNRQASVQDKEQDRLLTGSGGMPANIGTLVARKAVAL